MIIMDKNAELISNIVYTIFFSVGLTFACICIILKPSIVRTALGLSSLLALVAGFNILIFIWRAYLQKEPFGQPSSEEYLLIGDDAILWSDIDHISLRRSEVGNLYAAVYFKNDKPPKEFIIENTKDRETFISHLKENAPKKGYTFEIKDN